MWVVTDRGTLVNVEGYDQISVIPKEQPTAEAPANGEEAVVVPLQVPIVGAEFMLVAQRAIIGGMTMAMLFKGLEGECRQRLANVVRGMRKGYSFLDLREATDEHAKF